MKQMLITVATWGFFATTPVFAFSGLPDTAFTGTGEWKSNAGEAGSYTATMQIANNTVYQSYDFQLDLRLD